MKHFVIVAVLVAISTVLVNLLLHAIGLLPPEASSQALIIDRLFNLHFLVISFLFSLITVFLVYSMVVFRKKPGEPAEGRFFKGNSRLEVVWTLIPLATVLYFSYLGSKSLAEVRRVDPQALEVKVTAGQWYWSFEYPDTGIISKSLTVPVNRQILLKMTSKDVIHSFWVPEWRVKQDVLPGANLVKELRVTPTQLGKFTVMCSELCGGAHAYMNAPVEVLSQKDYDAWVAQQMAASSSDPVERGKVVATAKGCVGCHTVDGKKGVGPTWQGLFGSTAELADGSSVAVDEAYLKTSIIDPNAVIAKGFQPNLMPKNYAEQLNDQQINDLIEYIKSLK